MTQESKTQSEPEAKGRRKGEEAIKIILLACASVSVVTTVGIVLSLLRETISFFSEVSVVEFLTGTKWTPLFVPQHFGILPLMSGTLLVAVGSSIVALPIGLASAIYLSEYAPDRVRRVVKPLLEVLVGIPTVVYGYFALTFVTPILRALIPQTEIFNALSASIVMGIMIIPMVSSLSEDAMLAVPRSLREAAYALGATKVEVATKVVVPAAFSSVVASFVLALSRAIGETMIVTLAAGSTPKLTLNPLESIQTMTGYIAQISSGDTPHGSIEYLTIFAVGMTLFVMTLVMNVLAQVVTRKYREVY
ncbi:phosphate ABC transporter permease [Clostridiales bacterium PH28_bin88]|nr:phosphate ABC transporter permease [Clostridiales bacterium PH28_bin88]